MKSEKLKWSMIALSALALGGVAIVQALAANYGHYVSGQYPTSGPWPTHTGYAVITPTNLPSGWGLLNTNTGGTITNITVDAPNACLGYQSLSFTADKGSTNQLGAKLQVPLNPPYPGERTNTYYKFIIFFNNYTPQITNFDTNPLQLNGFWHK